MTEVKYRETSVCLNSEVKLAKSAFICVKVSDTKVFKKEKTLTWQKYFEVNPDFRTWLTK